MINESIEQEIKIIVKYMIIQYYNTRLYKANTVSKKKDTL